MKWIGWRVLSFFLLLYTLLPLLDKAKYKISKLVFPFETTCYCHELVITQHSEVGVSAVCRESQARRMTPQSFDPSLSAPIRSSVGSIPFEKNNAHIECG